jgi:Cu-processing system permease protein
MYQLDSDTSKVILSLLSILLLIVPLISAVFTTIHFYNSYEFTELMLSQPLRRKTVFLAQYIAVASSLCVAFVIGIGFPTLIYGINAASLTLLYTGLMLTLVFVSLAFLVAVLTRDKAKAIGVTLLVWFFFSLIYDAILLWVVYAFGEYPLDKPLLVLVSLNPVDLARILMILKLDISALMGYTGALYKDFFGNYTGILFSTFILLIWIIVPVWIALRVFKKKDI